MLPDEDAGEFEGLQAALVEELAPVGALQTVLARRVAVAAWRAAGPGRSDRSRAVRGASGRAGGGLRARADQGRQWCPVSLEAICATAALRWPSLARGRSRRSRPNRRLRPMLRCRRPRSGRRRGRRSPRQLPNEPGRAPVGLRAGRAGCRPAATLHEPAAPWLPNEPESATDRPPCSPEPAAELNGTNRAQAHSRRRPRALLADHDAAAAGPATGRDRTPAAATRGFGRGNRHAVGRPG